VARCQRTFGAVNRVSDFGAMVRLAIEFLPLPGVDSQFSLFGCSAASTDAGGAAAD